MGKHKLKIFSISVLCVCFFLTGCGLSTPTYGTGQVVSVRFLKDIAQSVSLKSKNDNSQLVMKSRPKLVFPEASALTDLPLPQKDVAQHGSSVKMVVPEQYSGNKRKAIYSRDSLQLNANQQQEYVSSQKGQNFSTESSLIQPPLSYH
ncbi:hypothetical protein [Bartonella sp. B30(2025)]